MLKTAKLFVYPVQDLARAKALYTKMLGSEPYVDSPYYVGFRLGDLEIGLDPNGHAQGVTTPIDFFQVDDIKQSVATLVEAGATVHQDIKDVGYGRLVASIKDTDGNLIGLMQEPSKPA